MMRPELMHEGPWCDEWTAMHSAGPIVLEAHEKGAGVGSEDISLHLSFKGDNLGDWYHRDEQPNCPSCGANLVIDCDWTEVDPWVWFLPGPSINTEGMPLVKDEYEAPHVCNYASRYKAKMCARLVTDGHRYCWQHRPTDRKMN